MPRLGLIVPLVLGVGCSPGATPSDSASLASPSPESQLVEVVPATEQRPYSFMLPEGWSVEETVHSDGGSFVISSEDSPSAGGKVYGVIEPSGKITKYVPPPSSKDIRAIEADGSEASEPVSITVSGRPAWRMLVTSEDPQPLIAMLVEVDAGVRSRTSVELLLGVRQVQRGPLRRDHRLSGHRRSLTRIGDHGG